MTSSRWHAHGNVYLVSEDDALTPDAVRDQAQGTDGIVQIVRAGDDGEPIELPPPAGPTTSMGWEVYPDAIYEVLTRLHSEYDTPPIYVTENGAAFADVRAADGSVDDPERIVYLTGYVDAVARAMAEGVPVRGYFVWSLLDNFEWSYGYSQRFGLIYVDFETLERVPKSSFEWYRGLAASGRAPELSPV